MHRPWHTGSLTSDLVGGLQRGVWQLSAHSPSSMVGQKALGGPSVPPSHSGPAAGCQPHGQHTTCRQPTHPGQRAKPRGAAAAIIWHLLYVMREAGGSKGLPVWAPGRVHVQPHNGHERVSEHHSLPSTFDQKQSRSTFRTPPRAVIVISLSASITMLPALAKGAQNGLLVSPHLTTVTAM